ncbi:YciI family protein [Streptomyces sp. NPDC046727]|uniref:YciI family protein n=1 Tax=Streptomyces sp. NPDC046727 TaxID=3155373 RepID=UPI00340098B6
MSTGDGLTHVLIIRNWAPAEVYRQYTPDHIAYLDRFHAAGVFRLSGRSTSPGHAGVIIAEGVTHDEISRIVEDDPYVKAGVCEYQIVTVEALSDRRAAATIPTE